MKLIEYEKINFRYTNTSCNIYCLFKIRRCNSDYFEKQGHANLGTGIMENKTTFVRI